LQAYIYEWPCQRIFSEISRFHAVHFLQRRIPAHKSFTKCKKCFLGERKTTICPKYWHRFSCIGARTGGGSDAWWFLDYEGCRLLGSNKTRTVPHPRRRHCSSHSRGSLIIYVSNLVQSLKCQESLPGAFRRRSSRLQNSTWKITLHKTSSICASPRNGGVLRDDSRNIHSKYTVSKQHALSDYVGFIGRIVRIFSLVSWFMTVAILI
jgi:hypothetical protein